MKVRKQAEELVRYLPQKDWVGEVHALWEFVRDRIRYLRDTSDVERLQTADQVLTSGQGDCDDKSIVLASLLESIGHPSRFVAVGKKPNNFSHVFVETKIGNKWLALETTEAQRMGWRPPNVKSIMIQTN